MVEAARGPRHWQALVAASLSALAIGCTTPAERAERQAVDLGLQERLVQGDDMPVAVFERPGEPSGASLHVYLGGDGSPRRASRWQPPDPTPPDLLVLRLMALDAAPSLYIGRPCHHAATACNPWYWTIGRYSESVVGTIAGALRSLMSQRGDPDLVLIGFSGGGAIAMLLAERFPEVRAVVTVAGNLDHRAWSDHHGFARLTDSLDPAQRPPLRDDVLQLHLRGGRDRKVPPQLTDAAIARQTAARGRVYAEFDHRCCWEEIWPEVLAELDASLRTSCERPP